MYEMSQCRTLCKRIRSFFIINLDFYFFNDNVFHFGKKNLLPMFKILALSSDAQRNNFQVINNPKDKGKKAAT